MFMRKYQRIAQQYKKHGVTFLEIFGDDTKETRVRACSQASPLSSHPPRSMAVAIHLLRAARHAVCPGGR